jgi:hypothetical protein
MIDAAVASISDGKERGQLRARLMHLMCEMVRVNEDAATQKAFAELMYEHGYHRPW